MPNLLENQDLRQCRECNRELQEDEVLEHNGETYCEDCEGDIFYYCDECELMVDSRANEPTCHDDRVYCEGCRDEHLTTCEGCGNTLLMNDEYTRYSDINDSYYCDNCYSDTFSYCEGCGTDYYRDDVYYSEADDVYYCEGCYSEHNHHEADEINLENNTFTKIKSSRKFGIELEVEDREIDTCSIRENTCFTITDDGSLDYGYEFVSPILQGDIGYNKIKELTDIIKGKNVSRHTGYHLHLDSRDYKAVDLRKIWLLYNYVENIIYRMLPTHRYMNNYCKKVSRTKEIIKDCVTMSDFKEVWYQGYGSCSSKYNSSRYHGLNLHAYFYQGTIEIRYHTGTTNFNKIIHWINLHNNLMDYALNHSEDSIDLIGKMLEDTNIRTISLDRCVMLLKILGMDEDFIEYYKGRFNKFDSDYR